MSLLIRQPRVYLRLLLNSKATQQGEKLIMLRVRIHTQNDKGEKKAQSIDLSTGIRTHTKYWLPDKQSLSSKYNGYQAANERLRRLYADTALFCERCLQNNENPVLKLKYETKPTNTSPTLLEYCKKYLANKSNIKENTLLGYKYLYIALKKFTEHTEQNITLITLNENYIYSFANYLLKELKNTNYTVRNRLVSLRTILRAAVKENLILPAQFENAEFRYKYTTNDIALTEAELRTLIQLNIDKKELDDIRKLFLFLCFTGIRYSDLGNIVSENIKYEEKSQQYFLLILMQKTDKYVSFPLNKHALEILRGYNYQLPQMHQYTFNFKIKQIGKLAGFEAIERHTLLRGNERIEQSLPRYQLLSSHVGRRTWATLSFLNGIPIETISMCLGHATISQTQKYLRLKTTDFDKNVKNIWDDLF